MHISQILTPEWANEVTEVIERETGVPPERVVFEPRKDALVLHALLPNTGLIREYMILSDIEDEPLCFVFRTLNEGQILTNSIGCRFFHGGQVHHSSELVELIKNIDSFL